MLELPDPFIARRAVAMAERRMNAARVLVVNGPRQVGKTSVLGVLNGRRGGTYVSLDRTADLRAARTDPGGFVTGFDEPLFIDEVQRGGDPLLLAVKFQVDQSPRRGCFVLAGSTRFLTEPRLSESLAGRVRFVDMWPLSQGEIDNTDDRFIDVALTGPRQLLALDPPLTSRQEVFERVCRGGFPEAVLADTALDRREFFADYVRTITSKDVRELADIHHTSNLRTLANLIAARTATELTISGLAREVGIPPQTFRRYLPLFETIYLHHLIPAWSRNLTAKAVHRPKIHMVDSGLAAHLVGSDVNGLTRPTATHSGHLLETFVAGELSRQLSWTNAEATLYHWRDRGGVEVDLVLETPDGRVVGIEVKAGVDVRDQDFAGLRSLARKLGEQFIAGIVLHCGDRPRSFGSQFVSLPVSSLWASG